MPGEVLHTIGHSTHSADRLVELLVGAGITAVADVRSAPWSRREPQHNRDTMRASLRNAEIAYAWLPELGGRPDRGELFDAAGHARYDLMAASGRFAAGLERLTTAREQFSVAVLCSEGDCRWCHRRLLVGRVAAASGVEIRHIGTDGAVTVENWSRDVGLPLPDGEDPTWRSKRPVRR